MVYINILTYLNYNLFDQQLDKNRFSEDYCFYENSTLDIEWDLVVVFETIKTPIKIKCKKGGLIFIAAEPPLSSFYSKHYLKQFDIIYTAHPHIKKYKNIVRKQYFNDWHFGFDSSNQLHKYTFDEIVQMKIPNKTKNISVITSSQAKMPLHLKRLDFLEEIKQSMGDRIDFYGRGFNFIEDKGDAMLPYRFHICIENTIIDDLWTEKFADPLLAYSVPIYIGCSNMEKYFLKDSFYTLNINDANAAISLLNSILSDPVKHYNMKINNLIKSREMLINKYNIFPELGRLYNSLKIKLGDVEEYYIKPNSSSIHYIIFNYNLRLKRFIYKKLYNLKKTFQ